MTAKTPGAHVIGCLFALALGAGINYFPIRVVHCTESRDAFASGERQNMMNLSSFDLVF